MIVKINKTGEIIDVKYHHVPSYWFCNDKNDKRIFSKEDFTKLNCMHPDEPGPKGPLGFV